MTRVCLLIISMWLGAAGAISQPYYVATQGNDEGPGSLEEPWRTIQKAADAAVPGSTVHVREGVYNEQVTVNVSGSGEGAFTTFRSFDGETAIVDGSGLGVPANRIGLFDIVDRSYIRIEGLEFRGFASSAPGSTPAGIHVSGRAHHVEIVANRIHDISSTAGAADANAHGIAVYGTGADSIHDLLVDGNELFDLTLGSSEALVLNGNVERFTISNNQIHDVDNIGIDLIGFEEVAPDPRLDQARNGVVSGNTIWNVSSFGNPAYGDEYGAGGIYVDGGRDIVIERNRITAADIGIELASEHAGRETAAIVVRNNLVLQSRIAGVSLGGFDERRGRTAGCRIVNNTLVDNDTERQGNGEISLQFDTVDNVIANNILFANDQSLLIGNPFTTNVGNVVDHNLYFAPNGINDSDWEWRNETYTGFSSYSQATGNDVNGDFVDPALRDSAGGDLSLQTGSPAIDSGSDAICPDTDFAGTSRPIDGDGDGNAVCDIGAYEAVRD